MKTLSTHLLQAASLAVAFTAVPAHAGGAEWINTPQSATADDAKAEVALLFRKDIVLASVPRKLVVNVSADQRFIFYVNGKRVVSGPSRGDLKQWRYEAVDIAPYLKKGANVLAAQVWSDGPAVPLLQMSETPTAPVAQISSGRTAFYVAAADPQYARLFDTGVDWKVRPDKSRTAKPGIIQLNIAMGPTYYVAGNPEIIDGALIDSNWNSGQASADGWQAASIAKPGTQGWTLVADQLPAQGYKSVPSGAVVRATGIKANGFPAKPVTIPANSEISLMVDAGRVLAAYPILTSEGGKGATISVSYVEALYDPQGKGKGDIGSWQRFSDRSNVSDGLALGLTDSFKPSGGADQFAPYWWRVWRFAEIKVKTGAEPLKLTGFRTYETGFPFETRAHFKSSDRQLDDIWMIGWQTVKLGAHETFMDTAYWEQLQYIGDTRIQAKIAYDVSGDPRLPVQALDAFNSSRQVAGIPQAAWPQSSDNVIPPFALLSIGMLHDYYMRQPDTAPVARNLDNVRAVLDWYKPYLRNDGILKPTPGWPFIDWRPSLNGMDRKDGKGPDSCIITLQYYGALKQAAELERAVGTKALADADLAQAEIVRQKIDQYCYDNARGLYADNPDKAEFSQHANALAVLYDIVPKDRQKEVLDKIVTQGGIEPPAGIIGTTYYFSYYLAEALDHAGLSDRYHDILKTWRALLAQNFTSWPEAPDPVRSDSHAWSAHPTSGLLTYVAGIKPAAPGFASVSITPHLGALASLDAAMAHPLGAIRTVYTLKGTKLKVQIDLPKGLTGNFEWKGSTRDLKPGRNRFTLSAQ